jgi:hypothetical protein
MKRVNAKALILSAVPSDALVELSVPARNSFAAKPTYISAATLVGGTLPAAQLPGDGITSGTGTVVQTSVTKEGDFFKTTILVDVTGLGSSTTDLDIIGKGTSPAYLAQITAAVNGTIFRGQVTCLETPATGVTDIDFYAATEGTGVFDGGIAALAETALLTKGGVWAADSVTPIALSALPAADKYIYLVNGAAGVVGTYTAGQFLFEFWGA